MSEAATGGAEIARNIEGVAIAADATSKGVAESQKSAVELSEMAGNLKRRVDRFTDKLPSEPAGEEDLTEGVSTTRSH